MPKDMRVLLTADSSGELQEDVEKYQRAYPNIAYDTRLIRTYTDEKGKYCAIISRLDSCD